jgi:hypothetical protein
MAWFDLCQPEMFFAFVNSVVRGLFGTLKWTTEENVFEDGTRGNILRERSLVMGNWEEKVMLKWRKRGVNRT